MAQVTVTSSGQPPRTYELNKPRIVLGRDPAGDIHLDNLAVSKHHCEILNEAGNFIVRDLKSSNKTFVNGKEVTEHRLASGDEIVIGLFSIKFAGPAPDTAILPKPAVEEGFEPTMQLPPEMIRKKMEEMQREREQGGMGAARAAAATAVKPQPAPSSSAPAAPAPSTAPAASGESSSMAVVIIVVAIIAVIVLNVVIYLMNKK
jgi:pSer/pThr/pTyr-binding forkhead associated (FHA) protein